MSGRRKKLNAVLLSLIMVLSMVAMSAVALGGTAAATDQPEVQDVSGDAEIDDSLQELDESGQEVTVFLRLTDLDDQAPGEYEAATQSGTMQTALESHAEATQDVTVDELQAIDGAQVENTFWIRNAILTTVDTSEVSLEQLAELSYVERIHPNWEIEADHPPVEQAGSVDPNQVENSTTWGLDEIDAPEAWDEFNNRGEGAKVAVFDTGVDASHPDIDLAQDGWGEFDENGERLDTAPQDYAAHGTHVSGTIAGGNASGFNIGVAPEADLYVSPFLGPNMGSFASVMGAFQWVLDNNIDVTNHSWGYTQDLGNDVYVDFKELTDTLVDNGVHVVASAGNEGPGVSSSPGNLWTAQSSAAAHIGGDPIAFSSTRTITDGDYLTDDGEGGLEEGERPAEFPHAYTVPDTMAPGVMVASAQPNGAYGPGDYAAISGTSMSAPHTSGVLALIAAQNPDLTADERESVLEETANHTDAVDEKDRDVGYGMINARDALALATDAATVEGNVTDQNGNPIVNAEVDAANGAFDNADIDGQYSVPTEAGQQDVTFDWLGYEQKTITVDPAVGGTVTEDVTLNETTDVELVDGQPSAKLDNSTFELVVDLGNVDSATVELGSGATVDASNVTIFPGNDNIGLGDQIPIEANQTRVTVPVQIAPGAEGDVEFDHTFTGASGDVTVTTGPTTVDPSFEPGVANVTAVDAPAQAENVPGVSSFADLYAFGTIENTGETTVEDTATWTGIGLTEPVELEPGETMTTGEFRWGIDQPSDGGAIPHGVATGTDTEGQSAVTTWQSALEVTDLTPQSAIVNSSSEITVTANVTNRENDTVASTVELQLDGEPAASEQMTFAANETKEVSFSVTPDDGGYNHSIVADGGVQTGTLAVGAVGVAEYDLGDTNINNEPNVRDVLDVNRDLTGVEPEQPYASELADTNRDGEITVRDVLNTNRLLTGVGSLPQPSLQNLDQPQHIEPGESATVTVDAVHDQPDSLFGMYERADFKVFPGEVDGETLAAEGIEATEPQILDLQAGNQDELSFTVSGATTQFVVDQFGAGNYTHGVVTSGGAVTTATVEIAPTQIQGSVENQVGQGIENVSVEAENFDTGETLTTETDADGSYTFSNIEPGTYFVGATYEGESDGTEVDVGLGETAEVAPFVFDQEVDNGTLEGTVNDTDQNAIEGAEIIDRNDGSTLTTTDAEGNYSVELEPGDYVIRADADGFDRSGLRSVSIEPNETTTVDFALAATETADPSFDLSNIEGSEYAQDETVSETISLTPDTANSSDAYLDDEFYAVELSAVDPDGNAVDIASEENFQLNNVSSPDLDLNGDVVADADGRYYINDTVAGSTLNDRGDEAGDVTADLTVAADATLGNYDLTFQVVRADGQDSVTGVRDVGNSSTASFDVSGQLAFSQQAAGDDNGSAIVGVEGLNSDQDSAVVVTYEDGNGNLTIAGLDTFNASELNGDDVVVTVEDAGGFPGEHTAHLIPQDGLSGSYSPGDTVSSETAANITANQAATVHSAAVTLDDQETDGDTVTVNTSSVDPVPGDGYSIAIHEVGGSIIGYSDVLNTPNNDNVEITLDETLTQDTDVFAMLHVANNTTDPAGAPIPQFNADATSGTVTSSNATLTVANVDFGAQALGTDADGTDAVVAENVVPNASSDWLVVSEGTSVNESDIVNATQLSELDGYQSGDDVVVNVSGASAGPHTAAIHADDGGSPNVSAQRANSTGTVFAGSVTIDDQTYSNTTDTVNVSDADLQDQSGDRSYFVAIHNVTADGNPIIGISDEQTGAASNITVTLDETVDKDITVRAMLHFSDDGSAGAPVPQVVNGDFVTVRNDATLTDNGLSTSKSLSSGAIGVADA